MNLLENTNLDSIGFGVIDGGADIFSLGKERIAFLSGDTPRIPVANEWTNDARKINADWLITTSLSWAFCLGIAYTIGKYHDWDSIGHDDGPKCLSHTQKKKWCGGI